MVTVGSSAGNWLGSVATGNLKPVTVTVTLIAKICGISDAAPRLGQLHSHSPIRSVCTKQTRARPFQCNDRSYSPLWRRAGKWTRFSADCLCPKPQPGASGQLNHGLCHSRLISGKPWTGVTVTVTAALSPQYGSHDTVTLRASIDWSWTSSALASS